MGQLTATKIKTLTEPGRYVDGDGLMMEIAPGGSRSWKLRVAQRIGGPSADMPSHTSVVVDVAVQVWTGGLPHWKKGRALGRLLTALVSGLEDLAEPFLVALENYFRRRSVGLDQRPDLAAEYIADWRRGHFFGAPTMPGAVPKLETNHKRNSRRRV